MNDNMAPTNNDNGTAEGQNKRQRLDGEAPEQSLKEKERKIEEIKRQIEEVKRQIEERNRQIEERNRQIEERNRQIEERNRQIEEKRQIEERNRQIEQKIKEKEEKIKQLDELDSVKCLLSSGIPKMRVNPACKPSIIPNTDAQKEVLEYRAAMASWDEKPPKPERPEFHDPAQIIQKAISTDLLEFEVNMENRHGLIKSSLALEYRNFGLAHCNITSPLGYISMVIEDAVACCGFNRQILVSQEVSLFSRRPNLLMVKFQNQLLFLANVENPSEGTAELEVFESEVVAGQSLSFLNGLKQHGTNLPFVLLSTYNQSVVARLGHPDDYTTLDEEYENLLMHSPENVCRPLNQHKPGEQEHHRKEASFSPAGLKDFRLETIGETQEDVGNKAGEFCKEPENNPKATNSEDAVVSSSGFDYKGCHVVYSQVFGCNDLFKVLALLVKSSFDAFQNSKETSKPRLPHEGDMLEKELCTLYDDGFSWEKVKFNQVTYNKAPQTATLKKCHIICVLGQGQNGLTKTLLCSSFAGNLFAVKLFLIPPAFYNESYSERVESRTNEAKAECDRWIELAPQHLEYYGVITLNGFPALTMPFFPPIPVKKREEALDLIKMELKRMASDKQYCYYDMRWKHFGCRFDESGKMEIALLDLGTLQEIEFDPSQTPTEIDKQMESLKTQINTEPPAKPGIVLA